MRLYSNIKKVKFLKGFTLIELLVVISIISLLTSISFSYLSDARQKGRDTEKIRAMIEIRKALQMYATEKGYFPASTSLLIPNYISSINPNIKYEGLNSDNTTCANNNQCYSYHLAIILERGDNKVLTSDRDFTTDAIDGTKDNCFSSGTPSIPDRCYDLVP